MTPSHAVAAESVTPCCGDMVTPSPDANTDITVSSRPCLGHVAGKKGTEEISRCDFSKSYLLTKEEEVSVGWLGPANMITSACIVRHMLLRFTVPLKRDGIS